VSTLPSEPAAPDLLAALKLALPYVQSVAARAPTTEANVRKVREARAHLRAVEAAIAQAEGRS